MRISLIPWEFIWLLSLLVFMISLAWTVVAQLRRRKFAVPRLGWLYLSLALLLLIPAGMRLTNYRFKLGIGADEATTLDHRSPDLVIREYESYTVREVYEASLRAMQQARTYGQPWTIAFADMKEHRVARLEAIVPVFAFQDRLSIAIQLIPSRPGLHVIAIGISEDTNRDYGENARHIVQFYRALDAELAKLPKE